MISGRGGAGTRGRIRPPRRMGGARPNGAPAEEGSDFETCWTMLREALVDIHNKSCGRLSFEQLYRAAYKIVLKKKGDVLYDRVKQFEEQWFADNVIPKIEVLVTKSLANIGIDKSSAASANERRQTGERFLKGIKDTWEDHNMSMNMTSDILMYLDRGYTQQEAHRVPIFSSTIALFRDHILRSCLNKQHNSSNQLVIDILVSVMLEQIDMERGGDIIDRSLLRRCSKMLSCLYETQEEDQSTKLYLTIFEPRFLENSREYYTAECERLLREGDAISWLRHTQSRLNEEITRCDTTIELETLPRIQAVIDQELIRKHIDDFFAMEGSGPRWMVDNDKVSDLAILYRLVRRIDDKKIKLQDVLDKRIVEMGFEIENVLKNTDFSVPQGEPEDGAEGEKPKTLNPAAQQTAAAIKWVDDVLTLKDKFDRIWVDAFEEDLLIQSSLTKSFSKFINLFNRSSEYVSLFIDENLKRGIRGKTEAEVDIVLEKAIVLIRYLEDKDMFQAYYQKHLARRLLNGKSESHDVEKQIISRMKQELGNQFTSKFEGMFKDLDISSDLTTGYKSHVTKVGDGGKSVDLHINVLSTNNWPPEVMGRSTQIGEGSRISCIYPADISRLQASFEQFYLTSKTGRKLTWVGTTGSADIRCVFPAIPGKAGGLAKERRYEVNVPTFGMVVMMLFNDLEDEQQLTFEEIQAKTSISTQDLMRTLTAIAVAPKSRVLLKDPLTKSVKAGDKFSFNSTFQSKTIRIKAPIINAVSKVEDTQQRASTEQKNNQARGHMIDAAIVRIMKSRKELSHTMLVGEVIGQLAARFKPDVGHIKKRIEDLIARDYLERPDDEEGPSMYRYLA